MTPHMESPWLKVAEAQQYLGGVSRSKLYVLMAEKRIPVIHLGRSVRISRSALDQFMAELEAESGLSA